MCVWGGIRVFSLQPHACAHIEGYCVSPSHDVAKDVLLCNYLSCLYPHANNFSWCDGSSDRSSMMDPLSYFSFQPVLHDCCSKGCGMCYPVCGMMHIKGPLLLIGKSSPCGGSGFPFSLSEWSLTICLMPYNRK